MRSFPFRQAQLQLLSSIFGKDDEGKSYLIPALIHLHDPNTPTSTAELLHSIEFSPSTIVIETDPLVDPTPASIFEKVLSKIAAKSKSAVRESAGDSIDVFLGLLSDWLEATKANGSNLVLIVKRAERLRDVWPEHINEALYNLAELVKGEGRVSLVTVSILPTSQFRTTRGTGLSDAIEMVFPRLSKEDSIATLSLDAEDLIKSDERHSIPLNRLIKLHSAFVTVTYDTFASDIRDLEEIRLLSCCVWYPFIEPLIEGTVEFNQSSMLFSRSSFLYRDALSRLHTRQITPQEWISQMVERVKKESNGAAIAQAESQDQNGSGLTLPLIPCFLLLAAFLASYNPSRLDVRYFVRDESSLFPDGSRNGKARKGKRKRKRGSDYNRQEMLGPKMFTLDRLMSIFQALITEAGPEIEDWMGDDTRQSKHEWWESKSRSVAVMEAMNHLVCIGALVRSALAEKIDNTIMYRVNITREVAIQVSHEVDFDLSEWLWDWES